MKGRVIVVLAIIIIIISIFGIFLVKNQNAEQEQNEFLRKTKLIEAEVIVAVKDIKQGEIISQENIKTEHRKVDISYIKDSFIIDKPLNYVIGSYASRELTKNSTLRYEDLIQSEYGIDIPLDISVKGELAFDFPLQMREYNIVKNVEKGALVDVYFRYEKKTKNDDNGIVSKSEEGSTHQNKENANLTNLILLFKDKRLLYIKNNKVNNIDNKVADNNGGMVSLQMKLNEIKSVYAIENLGRFYIFPSDNIAPNISTKKILSKDFIKELRGGF